MNRHVNTDGSIVMWPEGTTPPLMIDDAMYFSKEAESVYMGSTKYKRFVKCEAKALALERGEYEEKPSEAMLMGSYIHAWNEGKLDKFRRENPQIYKKNSTELLKKYDDLNDLIEAVKREPLAMMALAGEKEVIFLFEMYDTWWKIKIDSYNETYWSDLKTTSDMFKKAWDEHGRCWGTFMDAYDYFTQFAIYSEGESRVTGRGRWLDNYAVIADKKTKSARVMQVPPDRMEIALAKIEKNMPRINAVRTGQMAPEHCGICDYCLTKHKQEQVMTYEELYYNTLGARL